MHEAKSLFKQCAAEMKPLATGIKGKGPVSKGAT